MPSDHLLDTNTVVFLFQDHPKVRAQMAFYRPALIPFITVTELLYGTKRSGRPLHNLREYGVFLSKFKILYPDRGTLDIHSDLRVTIERLGRPIPQNDLWQAAIAIQHDAILVTNDSHFAAMPGLRAEDWTI